MEGFPLGFTGTKCAEEILKQKPERQLIKLKTEENSCLNPLW